MLKQSFLAPSPAGARRALAHGAGVLLIVVGVVTAWRGLGGHEHHAHAGMPGMESTMPMPAGHEGHSMPAAAGAHAGHAMPDASATTEPPCHEGHPSPAVSPVPSPAADPQAHHH